MNTKANYRAIQQFLQQYDLAIDQFNLKDLRTGYLQEMEQGLSQPGSSSLKMIPTYISADKPVERNKTALVLDIGGTNIRCALITLLQSGKPLLENFIKGAMPALKEPLSAASFLGQIAQFMAPVVEEYYRCYEKGPECLGLCFSYSTQICMHDNGDLDGKLLQWSKEVQVPELVGEYVGQGLLEALHREFGAKAPRHVCLINDTVATLLAGQSIANDAVYSDFIGYILGTGINSCYAESCENISSLDSHYPSARVIINVESGNYSGFPKSQVDRDYDKLTQEPGTYLQEKACSGRYWGELVCMLLRFAAQNGILPDEIQKLPLQESAVVNEILLRPSLPRYLSQLASYPRNPLVAWFDEYNINEDARERIYFLTEAMLERNALFTAVNMAACILRSGGGNSPLFPVCLTIDGSSFYALHRFSLRVQRWLDLSLDDCHYYRFKKIEDAPLLGAAIAALGFSAREQ